MKLARVLFLAWMASRLALAQPAPVPDYQAFLERVYACLHTGKYGETAQWVAANPALARQLYGSYYDQVPRARRSPAEALLDDRLLTIIALELDKSGDRSLVVDAQKRGWYQPDMVGYHPPVRFSFDDPEFAAQLRAANGIIQNSALSLSLGDHSSVAPLASRLPNLVKALSEAGRERHLIDMNDTQEWLALGNCLPELIQLERGDSLAVEDERFFDKVAAFRSAPIESSLFFALRKNANLSRLKRVLAEGRRRGRASLGGLAEFVYVTYEFDLRLQQQGDPGPEERLEQARRAFEVLKRQNPLQDVPAREIDIWVECLTPLLRDPKFMARANPLIVGAVQTSQNAGKEAAHVIHQQHLRLTLVRLCLQVGRPDLAQKTLESLGPHQRFQEQLQGDLDKLEQRMGSDPGFQPHLRDGVFARLMEEWIGLEMTLEQDRSKLPALFAEADEFGRRARPNLGWMAFEDPRWAFLDYLVENDRPEWKTIFESLQKECDRLSFRPGQARLLAYRAHHQKAAHPELALNDLNQAVALLESYLNECSASPAGRERLQQAYQPIYRALARLQIEQGKNEQAFETLQRQQQADALNRSCVNLAADARTEALQRVRGQGQELSAQFQANAQAGRDNSQTEQLLAKNKAEFHTVLNDLRRQYPTYESALAIRPVNFSKSQKYLPAHVAVVQYFPTADALYIFVVTRERLVIRQVPVGEPQLRQEVTRLQQEIFKPVRAPRSNYSFSEPYMAPLKATLCSLYQWLIAPVEGDLAGAEVLAFIPTGCLHYVPYSALARPRGEGLEFLVERYPCVSLVKSSDLDQVGRKPVPGEGGLLAFGNPDGSLPGAEVEVAQIARQFARSKRLLRDQATSAGLKKLEAGTRYLHLATHGMLDSSDPKKSYLKLAGGNLTLPQIYELNLDGIRLVTLSACETARESSNPGSEIASLAEAFSVAGTNSVVATLWSISDSATARLMNEFYKGLVGKRSLAVSLQQAEMSLMRNPATAHPFYWAPFVMLGDWR